MITRFSLLSILIVLLVVAIESGRVQAQATRSSYATNQLNAFTRSNSIDRYSIENENRVAIRQGVPAVGVGGVNRQVFTAGGGGNLAGNAGIATSTPKPFARLDRGPSVSPYLALANPFSTPSDYYNVVRPLQEQSRVNQQVARQQYNQNKRLNQMAAQGPYEVTGNDKAAGTGHGTGFFQFGAYMNTGGYFARPTAPKGSR